MLCLEGPLNPDQKDTEQASLLAHSPFHKTIPESSPQMRQMWMYLGTGEETPINYFLPLSDPADEAPNDETNENIIQNDRPAVNHEPTHSGNGS